MLTGRRTVESVLSLDIRAVVRLDREERRRVARRPEIEQRAQLPFDSRIVWSTGSCAAYALDLDAERLTLRYEQDGFPREEWIRLTSTPCYYGGVRWWGVCAFCEARAGVLYLDGFSWACRRCHDLVYAVTREDIEARRLRAVRRTRATLGQAGGIWDPLPHRPKRMWTSTYGRRVMRAIRAQEAAIDAFHESVTRLERRCASLMRSPSDRLTSGPRTP